MKSLQEEFKKGIYKIGNFGVHIVTNPITTLEGIRLNWDALQNPAEIKVFLSGLIGLMVFAAMPDDVIKNSVDSFNRKFKSNKTPDEIPMEMPKEVIAETFEETTVSAPIEENNTVSETITDKPIQNYEQPNTPNLSKSYSYQPSRLRSKGQTNSIKS